MLTGNKPRVLALVAATIAGLTLATPTALANHSQSGQVAPVIDPAGCNVVRPGFFNCFALKNVTATESATPNGPAPGLGAQALEHAYNLTDAVKTRGKGQTVAIVDAYDDPNAESDLALYRKIDHLSACTTANGCFTKVNQAGKASPLPDPDAGWAEEISLDLDMVSAACPNCKIVLVEAMTNSFKHLGKAELTAGKMAHIITNSFGLAEQFPLNKHKFVAPYKQPGVFIVASTGDLGYGEDDVAPQFPSVLPHVTAVGGTSLTKSDTARGWSESAWGDTSRKIGAGSGCSTLFAKPSWQHDSGCTMRMNGDVSGDADPATGVTIYDSYGGDTGFEVFGGTSASSPFIAGVIGLAENATTITHGYPYAHSSHLYDPVGGNNDVNNGNCLAGNTPKYFCNGVKGYDGPTGLGSPNGYQAF